MSQNLVWNILFTFIGLVAIWFSGIALYRMYQFYSLNAQTTTDLVEWSAREISGEVFLIEGEYRFEIKGEKYHGVSFVNNERFRNRWAAEDAIKKELTSQASIWFSQNNPDFSSLQKTFPVKECVSAGLLWGIFIYFIYLQSYVKQRLIREQEKSPRSP